MSASELVYGFHAVSAVLASDLPGVRELWVQESRRDRRARSLAGIAHSAGIAVHVVPRRTLDAMLGGAVHQGVVARYRRSHPAAVSSLAELLGALIEPALLLVLDSVEDPHNLGACLRSADAAGAQAVVAARSRSCGLTPAVRKVACGAAEHVPLLLEANLARALREMQESGLHVVGAAAEASSSLYDADLTGNIALVVGAEDTGLRRLTREHCDLLVRIPMAGRMSSLNVSVATGVCLFEARRQRLKAG